MKTEAKAREEGLGRILYEIAAEGVPEYVDLWPDVRAQVKSSRRRRRWAALRPATRLGWALLVAIVVLAVGVAAYSVAPLLRQLMNQAYRVEPGVQHVEDEGLSQQIDQSQTADGVTVTVQQAYADANRVIVGYTISCPLTPVDAECITTGARLSDEGGTSFPRQLQVENRGGVDADGNGSLVVFHADAVQGDPEALSLHLDLEVTVYERQAPPGTPTEANHDGGTEPTKLAGPLAFAFDFGVPFDPGRTVEIEQTVEAAGVAMRLEQVVLTPSETRANLCFTAPTDAPDRWAFDRATLEPGDLRHYDGFVPNTDHTVLEGEICGRFSFYYPLEGEHGWWTLTIASLVRRDPAQPGVRTSIEGPRAFRFRVP